MTGFVNMQTGEAKEGPEGPKLSSSPGLSKVTLLLLIVGPPNRGSRGTLASRAWLPDLRNKKSELGMRISPITSMRPGQVVDL